MPTRNTGTFTQIIEALGDQAPPDALEHLENHFKDLLIVVAGTTQTIANHAEELRLAITIEECGAVLDQISTMHSLLHHVGAILAQQFTPHKNTCLAINRKGKPLGSNPLSTATNALF